jgi:hypothetical protein
MTTKAARRAQAAEARADLANLATSIRYPVEGHWAGPRKYIGIAADAAGDWVVYDSNAGYRAPDYWNGTTWEPLTPEAGRGGAHCWTREQAEEWGRHFAFEAGRVYRRAVTSERGEFLAWLAGDAELAIDQVKALLDRLRVARAPVAKVEPIKPTPAKEPDCGPSTVQLPAQRVFGPDETAQYPAAAIPADMPRSSLPPLPPEPPDEVPLGPAPHVTWKPKFSRKAKPATAAEAV